MNFFFHFRIFKLVFVVIFIARTHRPKQIETILVQHTTKHKHRPWSWSLEIKKIDVLLYWSLCELWKGSTVQITWAKVCAHSHQTRFVFSSFFSRAINDLRSQFPCSFSHIRFSCIITVIMCEVQDARHSLSAWQATTCNTHHHCSWNLSLTVPVPVNVVRFTLRLWLLAVLLCYFCVYFVFLFRIILAYMYMCVCVHFSVLLSVKCSHFGIFSSVSYFVFHNKIYTQPSQSVWTFSRSHPHTVCYSELKLAWCSRICFTLDATY